MAKPTIFVFCNSCARHWHTIVALAEDGAGLTGHLCSDHGFIGHDMGFVGDWKHDVYNEHYPDGWQLEFVEVEDVAGHERLQQAFALNRRMAAARTGE
jgi:hypothetical protein